MDGESFTHSGLYAARKSKSPTMCDHPLRFLGTAFARVATFYVWAEVGLPEAKFQAMLPRRKGSLNETLIYACDHCNVIVEQVRASEEFSFPHINTYPRADAVWTGPNRPKHERPKS